MIDVNIFELERWLIARKRELGIVGNDFLPRNDGSRRTESKRQLLRAIAENAEARANADKPPTAE
jgi:hypothetical protein